MVWGSGVVVTMVVSVGYRDRGMCSLKNDVYLERGTSEGSRALH